MANETEAITIEGNFDCANCGMPSQEFPKWNVRAVSAAKGEFYFCSPRCMFIKSLSNESNISEEDSLLVTDYYELEKIDARTAYFIIKSDVLGPMGHDFVAVKDEKAAQTFKDEHKGEKIVRFGAVDNELISLLTK